MNKKQKTQDLIQLFATLSPEDRLKAIQQNIQQQNIAAANLSKAARAASEFEISYANDELDFQSIPVGDVRKGLKNAALAAAKTMRSVQTVQSVLEGGAA